jgi:hypothetical protein
VRRMLMPVASASVVVWPGVQPDSNPCRTSQP